MLETTLSLREAVFVASFLTLGLMGGLLAEILPKHLKWKKEHQNDDRG